MRLLLTIAVVAATTLAGAQVPRPAPELSWVGADGQRIQPGKYRGKVVVIEMLSTTCPHCQFTARILSQLQSEFGSKGLQVLGMAINDDANVMEFQRTVQTNFPIGKGNRDDALGFLQHSVMTPLYFPGIVIIDRSGVIQAQYTGTDPFLSEAEQSTNLRGMIPGLLGTSTGKPTAVSQSRERQSK